MKEKVCLEKLRALQIPSLSLIKEKPLTDEELIHLLSPLPEIIPDTLIIVNDADRSTPTRRIINLLRIMGKLSHPVKFMIATGTHKPPIPEQFESLTGCLPEDQVLIHDCSLKSQHEYKGITQRGTSIWIDKRIFDSPQILTINGVEPHYFAGFTGGIKSIIPGLSLKETTALNHRWALDPNARVMRTNDNPLFEDLWEAGGKIISLENIWSIQIVNEQEQIFHCSIGKLKQAFNKATDNARKFYGIQLKKKVNLFISFVQSPLNETLYQAQKAIENVKSGILDGGNFVLIANCNRGIGNTAFFEKIIQCRQNHLDLSTFTTSNYQFGDHKAFYWVDFISKHTIFYIGNLSADICTQIGIKKINFEDLFGLIQNEKERSEILVDEAGGFTALEVD